MTASRAPPTGSASAPRCAPPPGPIYWPIPITLATDLACEVGETIALSSDEGKPLGRIKVEEIWERDAKSEAERVYGTAEEAHPGVAAIYEEGNRCIAGPIEVDALPDHDEAFMRRYKTPAETKQEFERRGWKRIVAFQTRNPIHRAHEYLTKAALETCDGLFIQPLIGKTKAGDIPAEVRMRCYEVLMENYYPQDRVVLGVKPAKMHYAGPREAVLHAIVRRNYGATHFIVGRDHAGAGEYYGTYDAQKIFETIDIDELGIEPLMFEHTFWCNECEGLASNKTCPHDPMRASSSPGRRSARCSATAKGRRTSSRATRSPTYSSTLTRRIDVAMADEKGFTLWFTGLSGAGKTTISRLLEGHLRERGSKLEILDGDIVRENLSKGLGFSKEDRDTNIRRIAFVADLLSETACR